MPASRSRSLAVLTGLALALVPAAAHAAVVADPSVPGPYGSVRAEYDEPVASAPLAGEYKAPTGVTGATGPAPATGATGPTGFTGATDTTDRVTRVRRAGDVYFPANGKGPFKVVVNLHGNHATCNSGADLPLLVGPSAIASYDDGTCSSGDPTVDGALTIDEARSYQGYDYLADTLATQGYVVVSIDVNDITAWGENGNRAGYLARAETMSRTLDLLARWNVQSGPSGIGDALIGRVDLSAVGVMGHSRGGEGVNIFDVYNQIRPATAADAAKLSLPDWGPRYPVKAVFALAPTDGQGGFTPVVTNTNFGTILPYCDGDVFDLEGAPPFERSKAGLSAAGFSATQFLVNGANHNYFNTVWTSDDANLFGFGDPNCNVAAGPTRLSPVEQRRTGTTIMGAFMRRYVGGETQFDPIVKGQALPAYACPDEGDTGAAGLTVTCRNVIRTSYVAPDRRLLIGPAMTATNAASTTFATSVPTASPGGDKMTFTGFTPAVSACLPAASPGLAVTTTGCGSTTNRSKGAQLSLGWAGAADVTVALKDQDVSRFSTLNFRAAPNYDCTCGVSAVEPKVEVTLTDAAGRTGTVTSDTYSAALELPAGTTARKQVLSSVRIPLAAFDQVDLTQVKTVKLGFGTATPIGSIQLADVAFQEPRFTVGAEPGGTGTTGASGAAGSAGTTGAAGSDGANGTPGANGGNGANGADGTPGSAGTAGADGTGTPGAAAPPGSPARARRPSSRRPCPPRAAATPSRRSPGCGRSA